MITGVEPDKEAWLVVVGIAVVNVVVAEIEVVKVSMRKMELNKEGIAVCRRNQFDNKVI